MALTRNDLESVLLNRLGLLMTEVGMDGIEINNADLNDPLGYAVRQLGGTVDSIASVDDDDIGTIPDADTDKLLDYAEFRLLDNILAAARRLVSITVGPRSEGLNQIAAGVAVDLDRKRAHLKTMYGHGSSKLQGGMLSLRFAEQNEAADDNDI